MPRVLTAAHAINYRQATRRGADPMIAVPVLFLSALYSLPNLYPKDPAIQVSANRGAVVDAALKTRVEGLLAAKGIAWSRSEIDEDKLVIRVANADLQAKASNVVRPALGSGEQRNWKGASSTSACVPLSSCTGLKRPRARSC